MKKLNNELKFPEVLLSFLAGPFWETQPNFLPIGNSAFSQVLFQNNKWKFDVFRRLLHFTEHRPYIHGNLSGVQRPNSWTLPDKSVSLCPRFLFFKLTLRMRKHIFLTQAQHVLTFFSAHSVCVDHFFIAHSACVDNFLAHTQRALTIF